MNRFLKLHLSILLTVCAALSAHAEILVWNTPPEYEDLQRFYADTYIFKNNGQFGIINSDGKVIIPAKYDFITPFYNGYSLIGVNSGGYLRLDKILSESSKTITTLTAPYYLKESFPIFSDGLLIVFNSKGKYGYLSPSGREVIKCDYADALPYTDGWAAVKKGKLWRYVHPTDNPGKPRRLVVNFNNNDITAASPFERGRAVVAYNSDYAVINTAGAKMQKITSTDFRKYYEEFTDLTPVKSRTHDFSTMLSADLYAFKGTDGRYGIRGASGIVANPQFDWVGDIYNDNTAIVSVNGRKGLAKFIQGNVTADFSVAGNKNKSSLQADKNGSLPPVTFSVRIPRDLGFAGGKIMIDRGNGSFTDLTSSAKTSGDLLSVTFTPIASSGANNVTVRANVVSSAVNIPAEQTYSISRKSPIRFTAPGPAEARANSKHTAGVSATIYNDSDSAVTVTVSGSWSGSYTIAPHSSKTLYKSFNKVMTKSVHTVSLTVNGVTKSSRITLIPFF